MTREDIIQAIKEMSVLDLKSCIVEGEIYDENKIKQLATIPSKEVLIAKLLGSIRSPISSFARVLSAIADSKGTESAE
jgi:large subunit ribosomal protein L10